MLKKSVSKTKIGKDYLVGWPRMFLDGWLCKFTRKLRFGCLDIVDEDEGSESDRSSWIWW